MAADYVISTVLQAHTGQYKAEMDEAARSTDRFDEAAKPAGRSAESLGSKVMKLGAYSYGAKKAFDATVGAAMSWESAFAGVQKTVDGTASELEAIGDGLVAMSKEIPTTSSDLAEIAAAAGQLGIETPNVLGFTRVIADLGETTNLSGDQAATSLARLANITGMAQGDFDRLGSTIVDLGNNLATTESEIVEFGMRIAGAGTQVGMTEHEILALGAALSSVGINAEAGGTAISKVMIEIASEVENSGDNLEKFARVAGMSAEEFSRAWRDDAAGALVTFITGLGDTEAQGMSTLQVLEDLGISEQRMRDALLRTSSASDVLNRSLAIGEDAWDANVALAEEAAVRYDTAEAKIQILKNTFAELGIVLGEGVTPALADATEGLTRFLNVERDGRNLGESMVQGFMKLIPGLNGYKLGIKDAKEEEEAWQRSNDATTARLEGLARVHEKAARQTEAHAAAQAEATTSVREMNAALFEQHEAMLAQIDPVFALSKALEGVESAQDDFNEAVKKHGPASNEARRAALALTEAVSKAEAAAIDGDMSFLDFDRALRRWVEAGVLTAQQADASRERVAELRGEAERFAGDYKATISVDSADALNKIFNVHEELRRIPRNTTVSVSARGSVATTAPSNARAVGGPVTAGQVYTVGERGPETFVPGTSGYILPNGAGGGVTVNVHVAGSIRSDRDVADMVAREFNRAAALTGRR